MIHTIYRITNLINEKTYIGYTSHSPDRRFRQHCQPSGTSLINKAIKKYGEENFSFDVLYQSKDRDHTLFTMEEYFIRVENSHANDGHGYNRSYGGTSNNRGITYGTETRKRMSKARIGKKRPNSGAKISSALKGRVITDSHREKLRQAQTGKVLSEETKSKMRKSKNFTTEQRAAMADRARNLAKTRNQTRTVQNAGASGESTS